MVLECCWTMSVGDLELMWSTGVISNIASSGAKSLLLIAWTSMVDDNVGWDVCRRGTRRALNLCFLNGCFLMRNRSLFLKVNVVRREGLCLVVLPNPPEPRLVGDRLSTISINGVDADSKIICDILSPSLIVNGTLELFRMITLISPLKSGSMTPPPMLILCFRAQLLRSAILI